MNLLNKILCFMWGHFYITHSGSATIKFITYQANYIYKTGIIHVAKCKYCGMVKP